VRGHGKVICRKCGAIVHECRCTSPDAKLVRYVMCQACEEKREQEETKMADESEIKPGDLVCLKGTNTPKMVVGVILGTDGTLKAECWWSDAASFYANGGPMVTSLKNHDIPVAALVKA